MTTPTPGDHAITGRLVREFARLSGAGLAPSRIYAGFAEQEAISTAVGACPHRIH